jgi:16S rRNA processing protein RimM
MPKQKRLQEFSQPEGSPESGEPLYLAVGRLLRPHGLAGELLMDVYTDFPERLKPGSQVFVGENHQPTIIHSRRGIKNGLLIGFESVSDSDEAGNLRNQTVYVRAEDIPPLPEGEYYHHQILGLRVITDEGQELGTITGILDIGSTDIYVVRSESKKEILLPNIASVVKEIYLDKGEMHIHLMEGLLVD